MFDFISNWFNHGWSYACKSSRFEDKVEDYENWTVQIAKNEQDASSVFQIKEDDTHSVDAFNDDLLHFSKEIIEIYGNVCKMRSKTRCYVYNEGRGRKNVYGWILFVLC